MFARSSLKHFSEFPVCDALCLQKQLLLFDAVLLLIYREIFSLTFRRKECFTSDYFKGCLDVLLLTDEVEKIQMWIKQLHGADPGV